MTLTVQFPWSSSHMLSELVEKYSYEEGGREGGRDHMAAFLDSAGAGALCATSVPATVLRIYLQFLLGSRKVNIETTRTF